MNQQKILFKIFILLTLFRMGQGGQEEGPLPVLTLQLLQTLELATKTFWLLVLILLPYWCKLSRSYLVAVRNYWT